MRIKNIFARWLHVPIPPENQHVSDFGRVSSFDSVLVRIETECGLIGWGEAKEEVGSAANCRGLVALINEKFGPLLIGEDPRQINRLYEFMYNGSRGHYAIDHGHVFPMMGRRGVSISAISGIDMALWDLLGKHLQTPVWQLLGGRKASRMPAYASGGWADAQGIGTQLKGYVESGGFKAVKMRVGVIDGDPIHSAERVRAARKALGPDIGLACDAHGTYTVAEAKRFCRLVEDCNLLWFEEPVTADDKRGMAEVRAATAIPIAAGESEFTRFDFRDLAELRAADVFQPDLAICGGISEAMRIGAIASAWNLKLAPHLWTGALAFAAGMHVAAASPSGWILEYSVGANPLLQELAQEQFIAKDGCIDIPDRPGLGVTIRQEFIEQYTVA
ncbi:mandelate racemase/muconate lactonizing enzyme family protein [Pusillimonas sp. T7-7]|uniref:mandelate racemase/muconate lactonizing enzyme family protein n=1 Tax=Pusillimonas sp. (strain T7-7) TaxID=1007105 RepID=UPI0005A18ED0|nr:mandelate racemase/muconate lactonizing enzyme family protein [Pusillimonas sp. T7-7]